MGSVGSVGVWEGQGLKSLSEGEKCPQALGFSRQGR